MTNSSPSDDNTSGNTTGQSPRDRGGSATPPRKAPPGVRRKPRVPGLGDVAGAATAQAVGGVGRAAAGGRLAAGQAGRAAGAVTKTGRSAAGAAARGSAGVAETGKGAVSQLASAGTDVAAGVGDVGKGAGNAVTGAVGSVVGSAVAAVVVSAVRVGARMCLSFLIGKALLLLELIKRLSLAAVDALARLANRLKERLEGASSTSGDTVPQGAGS